MRSFNLLAVALILGVSSPALADSTDGSAASPAAAASGATTAPTASQQAAATPKVDPAHDPDKVICHYITPTGSRLGGQKVCHTRREWNQNTQDSQDALNHATGAALQRSPPGN